MTDNAATHTARRNPYALSDPCLFRGARSKIDPQSWHCSHPNHTTATLDYCGRCHDNDHSLKTGPGTVRTWALGVTTAPRREPTLSRMLESLRHAGWNEAYIFAEPGSADDGVTSGHRWCSRGQRLGMFSNWYLSLTELTLREPEADAYVLCQDDIVFCEGVRSYLEQILWASPSPQVLSIYCAAVHDRNDDVGFRALDEGWQTCGALTLIFPNVVARALLCDSMFLHHRRNGSMSETVGIDSVVGSWCQKSGITYYVHSPSLVQHIGQNSTLWGYLADSPRRSACSFPGESVSIVDTLAQ